MPGFTLKQTFFQFNLLVKMRTAMEHLHQGQSAAFWRPVPCGNSDQMGSAMNYPAQLLVVSIRGQGAKKRRSFPEGDVP